MRNSKDQKEQEELFESLRQVQTLLAAADPSDLPALRGAQYLLGLLQAHCYQESSTQLAPATQILPPENKDDPFDEFFGGDTWDWASWSVEAFETSPTQLMAPMSHDPTQHF